MSLSRFPRHLQFKTKFTFGVSKRLFSTPAISKPMIATLKKSPIIPVLSITDIDDAVPLVNALSAGGLNVVEIALRTPQALKAIEQVRKNCGDKVTIGAATIITISQFKDAINAGAEFAASPLFCTHLMDFARAQNFPYTPCVFTTAEINLAAKAGFIAQKLFPMDQMGDGENGEKFLRAGSTQSILKELGVTFYTSCLETNPSDVEKYLKFPSVAAVASGWSAPEKLIAEKQWAKITVLAKFDRKRADTVIDSKNQIRTNLLKK